LPFIRELQLQDTCGIFNDLSMHQFKYKQLSELKDEFWRQNEEEELDDTDPEINSKVFA
jgi:hypothetical protein